MRCRGLVALSVFVGFLGTFIWWHRIWEKMLIAPDVNAPVRPRVGDDDDPELREELQEVENHLRGKSGHGSQSSKHGSHGASAGEPQELPLDEGERSYYWPMRGFWGRAPTKTVQERLKALRPLWYLHIPATAFLHNTLMHHADLCPDWPQDAVFTEPHEVHDVLKAYGLDRTEWRTRCGEHHNFDGGCPVFTDWTFGHHFKVMRKMRSNDGHGVTVLQQPERRIVTGFLDDKLAWPPKLGDKEEVTIQRYAEVMAGCTVKVLTRLVGKGEKACGVPGRPTREKRTLAMVTLQHGFAFIGIQEEWHLTLCLFHAMFGGKLKRFETWNGRNRTLSDRHMAMLGDFQDHDDGMLYDWAASHFQLALGRYKVEKAACERLIR